MGQYWSSQRAHRTNQQKGKNMKELNDQEMLHKLASDERDPASDLAVKIVDELNKAVNEQRIPWHDEELSKIVYELIQEAARPKLTAAQHNAFPRGRWSSIILAALLCVSAAPALASPAAQNVAVTPILLPVAWDWWYAITWESPNKNATFEASVQVELIPDLWITAAVYSVGYDVNTGGFWVFVPELWSVNRVVIVPVKHQGQAVEVRYP